MPKYAEEILAAVTELQQHPTAEQVFLEMKREHPRIALGTVYKHLKSMATRRRRHSSRAHRGTLTCCTGMILTTLPCR